MKQNSSESLEGIENCIEISTIEYVHRPATTSVSIPTATGTLHEYIRASFASSQVVYCTLIHFLYYYIVIYSSTIDLLALGYRRECTCWIDRLILYFSWLVCLFLLGSYIGRLVLWLCGRLVTRMIERLVRRSIERVVPRSNNCRIRLFG